MAMDPEERRRRRSEYQRRYYQQNREKAAEYQRAYAARNRERIKARTDAWRDANKRDLQSKDLQRKYGIDLDRYEEVLAAQGGVCAVCARSPEAAHARPAILAVDHDHSCCPTKVTCGQCIRGLLCRHCNLGAGQFDHSPSRLREMAAYLEKHGRLA